MVQYYARDCYGFPPSLAFLLPGHGVHAVKAPVVGIQLDVGGAEAELVHLSPRLERYELEDALGVGDESVPREVEGRGVLPGAKGEQVGIQVDEEGARVAPLGAPCQRVEI